MDWTVYWYMLPVCVLVAGLAMFSGISGAAMLTPFFLIGFPLLGVPTLTTVAAIGTSLFLETSGFGSGVYGYLRRRLVDWKLAGSLIAVSLPAGALGAVLARNVPAQSLRISYGVAMLGLAWLLLQHQTLEEHEEHEEHEDPCRGMHGATERELIAAGGVRYRYCIHGMGLSRLFSGIGGGIAGLISTGIGEATLPTLVRRVRLPIPVAAATSTVVVAGTVVGAAVTHLVQLAAEGGFDAIPWNLIVWAVPGALIGAQIGTTLQGRLDEALTRRFFAALFAIIGVTFFVAFTVFRSRFAT